MEYNNRVNYRKKKIIELVSGDILLHNLYRVDGLLLIKQNKELNESLIRKIKTHISSQISILVADSKGKMRDFVDNKYYNKKEFIRDINEIAIEYSEQLNIKVTKEALVNYKFENIYMDSNDNKYEKKDYFIKLLCETPLWYSLEKNFENRLLKDRTVKIKSKFIETMKSNELFFELLNKMKNYKDILLIHSINTLSTSLMIGLAIELDDSDLIELAIAALFANSGYVYISKKEFEEYIFNKNKNIFFYKKHLEMFNKLAHEYSFLRNKGIVYGVLDHHEYYNGEGVPFGKKGQDISLFGRIISIAQIYDEMVGGYLDEDGISSLDAISYIWSEKEKKYDKDILRILIDRTTFFNVGKYLSFTNGKRGIIIGFSDYLNNPHKPIIKFSDGEIVDLLK